MHNCDSFWAALDQFMATSTLVIDRPKHSTHPLFPDVVYPLDYGYLAGTTSGDDQGIDAWLGSAEQRRVEAVVCTVDLLKRDAEMKLLIGCSEAEMQTICDFLEEHHMGTFLIRRS